MSEGESGTLERLEKLEERLLEAEVIEKYTHRDAHVSPTDFVRNALREKIKRDALDLMERLHKGR